MVDGAMLAVSMWLLPLCVAVTSSYVRSSSSSDISPTHLPERCAGCTEQVHLSLGGAGQMVISFATSSDETASRVEYWGAGDLTPRVATGLPSAYTQIVYLDRQLLEPAMGAPATESSQLLAMQNTSGWAVEPWYPRGRGSSWKNPTSVDWGLGDYKNPAAVYNSPVIHTVTLTGLEAGTPTHTPYTHTLRTHPTHTLHTHHTPHTTHTIRTIHTTHILPRTPSPSAARAPRWRCDPGL